MNAWGWVITGYGLLLIVLASYVLFLSRREARLRERSDSGGVDRL